MPIQIRLDICSEYICEELVYKDGLQQSMLSKIKVCAVIRYLTVLCLTSAAIKQKIKEVYGDVISRQTIDRWRIMFLDGRADLNDDVHVGQTSVIDKDMINAVSWLLEQDAQVQVSKIEKYFQNVVRNPLSH